MKGMRSVYPLIAAACMLVACQKASDVTCQPGYTTCGGACVRTGTDAQNCGACGRSCGSSEACVSGACVPDCRASLHASIDDPWGASWDGIERSTATYVAARDACEAIGGRLPTSSELFRAGATATGTVGDSYQTNQIWSLAPLNAVNALVVSLADASTLALAYGDLTHHYRCTCPPPRPAEFTGTSCFTTGVSDGCSALAGNPTFNFDVKDRPVLLTRSAAMYECLLAGGELPTAERLVAAFEGGLENPTNFFLHTGDGILTAGYNVAYNPSLGTFQAALDTDRRYYRCFGPTKGGLVATVPNGFRAPQGERVIDGDPEHASTTYTIALFDCLSRGGHLPSGNELAAFVIQGLPGGAVGPRWTSDQTSTTQVETFAWSGAAHWPVDADLATTTFTANGVSFDTITAGRALKTASLPYRCVYYPVLPAYTAPSAAACGTNGCLQVAVGTRAHLWFQKSPRGGSAGDTFTTAVQYCASLGARLPSVRDYVEAIHAGLSGSVTLVTSDFVSATDLRTILWTGTYPTDADPLPPAPSTVPATTGYVNYLCMWTDEVR
jgi:hypothetical protein